MIKPNNVTGGIIIFAVFISLFVGIYGSFENIYGISRDGTSSAECEDQITISTPIYCINKTKSIADALETTTLIDGVKDVRDSLQAFSVPGNVLKQSFELLTGAGLGVVKIFLGFGLFPGDVVKILLIYWNLPKFAANSIGLMLSMYIYYILLRYLLKQE